MESLGFKDVRTAAAVDAHTLSMSPWLDLMFRDNDFGSRTSTIACACSHYFLWKHIADESTDLNGRQAALIVEDDCVFSESFVRHLDEKSDEINSLPVVFFGWTRIEGPDVSSDLKQAPELVPLDKTGYIGGYFCYSLTRESARALVDCVDRHGIRHGVDMVIPFYTDLRVYASRPQLAFSPMATVSNGVDSDV